MPNGSGEQCSPLVWMVERKTQGTPITKHDAPVRIAKRTARRKRSRGNKDKEVENGDNTWDEETWAACDIDDDLATWYETEAATLRNKKLGTQTEAGAMDYEPEKRSRAELKLREPRINAIRAALEAWVGIEVDGASPQALLNNAYKTEIDAFDLERHRK